MVAAHSGSSWFVYDSATGNGSLQLLNASSTSGIDARFGRFTAYEMTFAPQPAAGWTMQATAGCYPDFAIMLFDAAFPTGLPDAATNSLQSSLHRRHRTAHERAYGAGDPWWNISSIPVACWPCVDLPPSSPVIDGSLGYMEWADTFAWERTSFGLGLSNFTGGQLGGPLVLFNATAVTTGARDALVIGAADNFKEHILGKASPPPFPSAADTVLMAGPQGHLLALPAGYKHRVAVAPGLGIMPTVYSFGAALRHGFATQRLASEVDLGVTHLSYWADNGQIYDDNYWSQPGVDTAASVYLALQAYHASNAIPVRIYQCDPWWYPWSTGPCGFGLGCGVNWTANTAIWGEAGLQPLVDAGMHMWLYSSVYVPPPNNDMPFSWEVSQPFSSGPIARVHANDSFAFYSEIMRRGKLWNLAGYEMDFTNFNYLMFQDVQQTAGVYAEWMGGMSAAAMASRTPVQICMGLPSDVLLTVTLPAVTNMRASDDNDFKYAPATRWKLGLTGMLFGAVDIRPYFDGFWTTSYQNTSDSVYGPDYWQNFTELSAAVSVLSTGPVGIGDHIGYTNGSLVNMTCRSDGALLKPSTAAAAVDVYFATGGPGSTGAEVWQAFSLIPADGTCPLAMDAVGALATSPSYTLPAGCNCPWATLLAVDVVTPLTFTTTDFSPALPWGSSACSGATYFAVPWSPGIAGIAAACADGAPASRCGAFVNGSTGLTIHTGAGGPGMHHQHEIYSLAPVVANGWAFIGELGKFTRVSPVRVTSVMASTSSPSVTVLLSGAPAEVTSVAFVSPTDASQLSVVRVVAVTFPATGTATVVCTGAGPAAQCAEQ